MAGTPETGRSPRPGAIPQQWDAAAAAQRSGSGAGAHPQEVPEMAGCTPGVSTHRLSRSAAFQRDLPADDLRRRHQGGAGDYRTRQCGYAGEHLRPYPAVLPCRAGQEVRKRLLCQARHSQPAGCTRRRRTHHLHDGSFGIAQGCRPRNEGKASLSPAHLMQKRALIAMQYSALHHRTWKTPTVQKPCRNRALTPGQTKNHFIRQRLDGIGSSDRTPKIKSWRIRL